jgi:hypothetical protein
MEHVRVERQACRIRDSTHRKCNENTKICNTTDTKRMFASCTRTLQFFLHSVSRCLQLVMHECINFYTFFPTTQFMITCYKNQAILKLRNVLFLLVCKNTHHKADIVMFILAVLLSMNRWTHHFHQETCRKTYTNFVGDSATF